MWFPGVWAGWGDNWKVVGRKRRGGRRRVWGCEPEEWEAAAEKRRRMGRDVMGGFGSDLWVAKMCQYITFSFFLGWNCS